MSFRLVPGIVLGITLGLAVGVGAYTFVYAQGYSYMTDNAEACVNCHVHIRRQPNDPAHLSFEES